MKKIVLTALAVFTASAAFAADLPRRAAAMPTKSFAPAPVMAWQGGYIGAFAGYGLNKNINGFLGGVQGGYDYQFGSIVTGLYADYAASNVRGAFDVGAGTIHAKSYATVGARLGYAINPQFLAYGKVGYGFNAIRSSEYATNSQETKLVNGLNLGLGGEYKMNRNWSAFGEYRASMVPATTFPTHTPSALAKGTLGDVRVGVNYRF